MRQKTAHGHIHGEAFMLMVYACKECGHRETIWNSRDGVTPFCIDCPSCGKTNLQHINWRSDVYAPHHQMYHGQRFFRDGTPDEAEAIMRNRIESMRSTYPTTPEYEAELIKSARDGEWEFTPGWPKLDRFKRSTARENHDAE